MRLFILFREIVMRDLELFPAAARSQQLCWPWLEARIVTHRWNVLNFACLCLAND